MDDLRFYILFNSISVITGQWEDDNERMCAMEPRLRLRRFGLEWGSNPDRRSVGAPLIDGWIVDFSFYVLPNSISIISAR